MVLLFFLYYKLSTANRLNDPLEAIRGQTNQMMTGVVIPSITEDVIRRTWKWFDDTLALEPKLNAGTFVLIEMMQKSAFNTVTSRADTGWPRPNGRHILQIGTGALNGCSKEVDRLAEERLRAGAQDICEKYSVGDCLPRDFEECHNPVEVSLQRAFEKH